MTKGQHASIEWEAGDLPTAPAFGDAYFSRSDGLAESRHVFLAGNDLPARFCPGFHIGELGFGTGLNLAAALLAFRAAGTGGRLHFTSFEAYPMRAEDMARALAAFPEAAAVMAPLLGPLAHTGAAEADDLVARVILGDARTTLPHWGGRADAWFLDGFAPDRNPQMWEPALLAALAARTAPGGSAATYSAAGAVRRALAEAGFEVARVPGFGRKRHMVRAVRA